jgi:hypothetical protein
MMKRGPFPDCGAGIGQRHNSGCDVERCPHGGAATVRYTVMSPVPFKDIWR